jgi:hypothetical protein
VRGLFGQTDGRKQLECFGPVSCPRRAPEGEQLARMREQCHLHVLDHAHRPEDRCDLEGAADAESPYRARRKADQFPRPSGLASAIEPRSGRSWPLIMLKQVDFPAPFGPMSASSSPAWMSKSTPRTA